MRQHESYLDGTAHPAHASRPFGLEQVIVDRIFRAVMEHRLPPGTKLSENILCETFRTSRARVRKALLMLAERAIVELHSNRGAFVASPSAVDATDVFQARRTIEPMIIRETTVRITPTEIEVLKRHVESELSAGRSGDRHEAIRLSGGFHIKLAEYGGNAILVRFLEDLVARTSLIIGLFGLSGIPPCSETDHGRLIGAIQDRDAHRAAKLMLEHLDHIEAEVELAGKVEAAVDVQTVLTG